MIVTKHRVQKNRNQVRVESLRVPTGDDQQIWAWNRKYISKMKLKFCLESQLIRFCISSMSAQTKLARNSKDFAEWFSYFEEPNWFCEVAVDKLTDVIDVLLAESNKNKLSRIMQW